MTNREIAQILRNVAASYTIKNERNFRFQIIAYQRAADVIENSSTELRHLFEENKLDTLPGIGKSIKSYIEELYKTGKVKHFEWVTKGIPKPVFALLEVPTFGPKKAFRLVTEFNLKNKDTVFSDLEKLAKMGKIANLSGFGEKSEQDILRAISEYRQKKGKTVRMVLPYAYELSERVVSYLKKSEHVIKAYPLGSLRRMASTVGDIDIAVSTKNPRNVIERFVSYPDKDRVIEKGKTTASILTSSGRQIDLMTMPPDSLGSLLQHFTGSKAHNIHLREYALSKNLSLSEYGIKRKMENGKLSTEARSRSAGKMENFDTEKKFYEALGMDWIPPELREDTGEIELAIKHKLPNLVQLKDIKGDLHIHSDFPIEPSHDLGHDTMNTLIIKAEKLKYEYIGFSEHNPSVSKHTSSNIYTILSRRKDRIEQLKSSNKNVRIINLLEIDILASGNIAIDEKSLSTLDAAIVSIHSSFSMEKDEMTKRIINGLSNPKVKILAHPTGRMLNQRPGFEFDFEEVLSFCKKNNKALEINAWPTRLDLTDVMVRKAIENNVKLVINTDSHACWQMGLMKFGVAVARRGWATKNDILNTLSYNEIIRWLKS
ncbi:MAG: DNA polymerase III [Candidatus Levybacteria bacterium]|nr:DNA polymerase III [Candidatus Levybacteria bacterium]